MKNLNKIKNTYVVFFGSKGYLLEFSNADVTLAKSAPPFCKKCINSPLVNLSSDHLTLGPS